MQKFFFLILLLLSLNISYAQINSPQASPRQTLLQTVGLVDVKIDYSRPVSYTHLTLPTNREV